jgi:hypothetical protein
MFQSYLELGFDHILDFNGYDHILFLVALCAAYSTPDWKKILILVTAFTVGHSITLALSSLSIITINADLIELLIPVTILITALLNLILVPRPDRRVRPQYFMALFFGFIHGMGFSNYFKALLGREAEIILPLFAFNLGVELGQICIVGMILVLNYLAVRIARVPQRIWNLTVSLVAVCLAIYMIVSKLIVP